MEVERLHVANEKMFCSAQAADNEIESDSNNEGGASSSEFSTTAASNSGADTDGDASSVAATSAAPLATKRSTVDAALAEVAGLAGRPQPRPEF